MDLESIVLNKRTEFFFENRVIPTEQSDEESHNFIKQWDFSQQPVLSVDERFEMTKYS